MSEEHDNAYTAISLEAKLVGLFDRFRDEAVSAQKTQFKTIAKLSRETHMLWAVLRTFVTDDGDGFVNCGLCGYASKAPEERHEGSCLAAPDAKERWRMTL